MSVRESGSQIWEAVVCQAGTEGENCCAIEKWNVVERYMYDRPIKSISGRSRDWYMINVEVILFNLILKSILTLK